MTLNEARTRGKKACKLERKFYIIQHPQRGYEFTLYPATFERVVEQWTCHKRWKQIA